MHPQVRLRTDRRDGQMCLSGPMTRLATIVLTGLVSLLAPLTLLAGPAQAQTLGIADPADDATNRGLDFTRVTVANRDRVLVVRAMFVQARRGDVIISIDPRGRGGLRLISEYRPGRAAKNYVLPGAFSDRGHLGKPVTCTQLKVKWRPAKGVVRLSLPSRCLQDGDFGAIRFAFLSERGSDTDYGPEGGRDGIGTSAWIPRG